MSRTALTVYPNTLGRFAPVTFLRAKDAMHYALCMGDVGVCYPDRFEQHWRRVLSTEPAPTQLSMEFIRNEA